MDTWNNDNEMLLQAVRELTTKIAALNKKKVDTALLESLLANYLTKDEADTLIDEKIAAALEHALDDYATITGYFPEMSVGFSDLARQLDTDLHVTDTAPYLFRTAGGTAEIGDREEDEIVGGTVAVNQLLSSPSMTNATQAFPQGTSFVSGHKLLFMGKWNKIDTSGNSLQVYIYLNDGTLDYSRVLWYTDGGSNIYTVPKTMVANGNSNQEGGVWIYLNNFSNSQNITLNVIDLTQMFGSTIADYAYTLEQAQAGSGINWLKSYGFFDKYIPYNAGELVSVSNLTSHRMVGFNQLVTQPTRSLTVPTFDLTKASRIIAGKEYEYKFESITGATSWRNVMMVWDLDGNPITVNTANLCTITPSNANMYITSGGYYLQNDNSTTKSMFITFNRDCYVMFFFYYGDTTESTTINNANLVIHWDDTEANTYEPYKVYNYPLDDSIVLRGVPKLVNGQIVYDGDRWMPSGEVERNRGVITFDGTELSSVWVLYTEGGLNQFYTSQGVITNIISSSINGANTVCDRFPSISISDRTTAGYGTCYAATNAICFNIDPSVASTIEEWQTWLRSHPVTVEYEYATPTTEQATPYQTPQIVDNWGTEEYVGSPIPVGHNTRYPLNMRAKLEAMADNPSTDGEYVLHYEGGEATYSPLASNPTIQSLVTKSPTPPSTNGTYVLKATVSGSTITYVWVAE